MVEHIKDYPTALTDPWEFKLRNLVSLEEQKHYEVQKSIYLFGEDSKHFLVKDSEHPYIQDKPLRGIADTGREVAPFYGQNIIV
jgi:hypothetical protein